MRGLTPEEAEQLAAVAAASRLGCIGCDKGDEGADDPDTSTWPALADRGLIVKYLCRPDLDVEHAEITVLGKLALTVCTVERW